MSHLESLGSAGLIPFCAKCRRPVTGLKWWHDDARLMTVYEARCHGAAERTEIGDAIDILHDVVEIAGSVAFRPNGELQGPVGLLPT